MKFRTCFRLCEWRNTNISRRQQRDTTTHRKLLTVQHRPTQITSHHPHASHPYIRVQTTITRVTLNNLNIATQNDDVIARCDVRRAWGQFADDRSAGVWSSLRLLAVRLLLQFATVHCSPSEGTTSASGPTRTRTGAHRKWRNKSKQLTDQFAVDELDLVLNVNFPVLKYKQQQ